MKKSKIVKLVLVTGIAAACSSPHNNGYETSSRLNIRGDTTSYYSRPNIFMGHGYYHFIPFGYYYGGMYRHGGYESSGFSSRAGFSGRSVSHGGFGRSGIRVGG
jgi:hypothetical protein